MSLTKQVVLFITIGVLALYLVPWGVEEKSLHNPPETAATPSKGSHLKEREPGVYAFQVMKHLSSVVGSRPAGSVEEAQAAEYILKQFHEMNLVADKRSFLYEIEEGTVYSLNVVATKPGLSSRVVFVGAHMDSVSKGKGADDNASGVGVMLEAARAVAPLVTSYTIQFIAFGAEEDQAAGSTDFVSKLSANELEQAVAMINLDSLAAGDHMYIYGDEGEEGFVRELGLELARKMKLPVMTQAGLHPEFPAGTTGDWSDHAPFRYAGIPYGYLEATNWELGDQDGYTQTEKDGIVWHTEKDTLDYILSQYPGRVEEHLSTFTQLLTQMLMAIQEPPLFPN